MGLFFAQGNFEIPTKATMFHIRATIFRSQSVTGRYERKKMAL